MEKKLWYAVMMNNDDTDWGTGSFDRAEAEKAVKAYWKDGDTEAYIAVIDANYDDDGNPTTDGLCVDEIREFD